MSEKTIKIVADPRFFVFVNEKNKLNMIEFNSFLLNDNVKSNYVKNFVELSAMLRHFLNRNDVNYEMMLYFNNKEQKTKTIHQLELKSIKEKKSNERFLIFNFTKKFVLEIDDNDYTEEELDDYTVDFRQFNIKITPQQSQLWLEYLNKFAVDINLEEK
jgi:hypothetical protein